MAFFKSLSKYGLLPAVIGGNLVTKVLEKVTGKEFGRTTLDEASETTFGKVIGLGTLGSAGALAVAVAGVPASIGALKKLIPKSTLGKASALFLGGGVATSKTLREATIEAPFTLVKAGQKAGELVEGLDEGTKSKAKAFGTAGLVVAGVGAGLGAVKGLGKVKDILPFGKKDILPDAPQEQSKELAMGTETTPILPETQTVTPTKKPSKRRSKAKPQNINQNVKVSVNVGNKRYLNNILVSR